MYFALAGFDVFTVCLGLFLTYSLLGLFNESVATNQEWAGRLSLYSDINSQAQKVNAPGNDIFNSKNVSLETGRLSKDLSAFRLLSLRAREDLEANVKPVLTTISPTIFSLECQS